MSNERGTHDAPNSRRFFQIRFSSPHARNEERIASELEHRLRRCSDPSTIVRRVREHSETQDLGTTIEIAVAALGTPFAIAIAEGLRDFIARNGTYVEIVGPNGRVMARGDAAANIDAAEVARRMVNDFDAASTGRAPR